MPGDFPGGSGIVETVGMAAREGLRCRIGRRVGTRVRGGIFGITTCPSLRKTPFPKGQGGGTANMSEHTSVVVRASNCATIGPRTSTTI